MTENTPKGIYFDVKKKPFDIQIDNNKKEPKLSKNVRYTDKQNYRRYKTLTEPKLLSRIQVDANDSQTLNIQDQLQRLLGIKPQQKKDEGLKENEDLYTAPSPYTEPPNPRAVNPPTIDEKPIDEKPIDEKAMDDLYLFYKERASGEEKTQLIQHLREIGTPSNELEAIMRDIGFIPEPASGYRMTGDFGEEGLSAINEVSRKDFETLTGLAADDDFELDEEESKILESFDDDINQYLNEKYSLSILQAAARGKLARDTYLKEKDASKKIINAFREYKSKSEQKPEPTPSLVSGADTTAEHIEKARGRPVGSYGQNRRHEIAVEAIKQKRARNKDAVDYKVDHRLYSSTFGREYMDYSKMKGFKLPA